MKKSLVFLCALVFVLASINGTADADNWSLVPIGSVISTGLAPGTQVDVNLYFNYTGGMFADFQAMDLDFNIDLAEVTPKFDIAGDPEITWHVGGSFNTIGTQVVGNTVSYVGGNLASYNTWAMGSNLVATIPLLTVGTAQLWDGVGDFDLLSQIGTGNNGILDNYGNIIEYAGATGPDYGSVPIPSAIWLLGSAFIGLVGFRKKFRKT